jgi:hypothetical protein
MLVVRTLISLMCHPCFCIAQAREPVQQYMERKVAVAAQQLKGSPQQQEMQWQGQFVKALLVLQSAKAAVKEDHGALSNSPPLSMLFPTSVASSVSITTKAVAAAWSVINQLAPDHFRQQIDAGRLPGLDVPEVQQGVQQWVAAQSQQCGAAAAVRTVPCPVGSTAGRTAQHTQRAAGPGHKAEAGAVAGGSGAAQPAAAMGQVGPACESETGCSRQPLAS